MVSQIGTNRHLPGLWDTKEQKDGHHSENAVTNAFSNRQWIRYQVQPHGRSSSLCVGSHINWFLWYAEEGQHRIRKGQDIWSQPLFNSWRSGVRPTNTSAMAALQVWEHESIPRKNAHCTFTTFWRETVPCHSLQRTRHGLPIWLQIAASIYVWR